MFQLIFKVNQSRLNLIFLLFISNFKIWKYNQAKIHFLSNDLNLLMIYIINKQICSNIYFGRAFPVIIHQF